MYCNQLLNVPSPFIYTKMKIENKTKTSAEIKLYGQIGGWRVNADTLNDILHDLEKDGIEELVVRMHCYGGSVFEGDVIGGALAKHQ